MKSACMKVGLLVVLFLYTMTSWSQTRKISGTVNSAEDSKPLSGVTVSLKGKTATQTDVNGQYSIDAAQGDVLSFSFVGFDEQTERVGSSSVIDISLKAASGKMDEVVVVGYGTQSRRRVTGSIASVNSLALKNSPSSNVGTALQGTVPGLLVRQNTGQPGNTPTIVFRGGTGFDGSGNPMIILDGIFVPSLYGIDMNDVESIDVLKDAASAAIYGARAANGVIIVTTKKGKKGRSQVTYSIRSTQNKYRSIADNYLNAEEYLRMNRQGIRSRYLADSLGTPGGTAHIQDRGRLGEVWGWANAPAFTSPIGLYTTQLVSNANRQYLTNPAWNLLVDKNPFNLNITDSILYKELSAADREALLLRNSNTIENNINFSGANDMGAFSLGVTSLKDNGTIIGSALKRLSVNFNGTLNVNKRMKVGLNVAAYSVNPEVPYNDPGVAGITGNNGGLIQRFLGVAPTIRYTNDTSGAILPGPNDITLGNPTYWSQLDINKQTEQRFSGGINLEYALFPYLKVLSNINGYMRYGSNNFFRKSFIPGSGGTTNNNRGASFSNFNDYAYTYNGFLEFTKSFSKHNVKLLGGGEFYEYKRTGYSGFSQGAITDVIPWLSASATPTVVNGGILNAAGASSGITGWERLPSVIGRLNYEYNAKYFLQGIMRYDGSSRLSADNYYGLYSGVSAGWNLHKESFFENSPVSKYVSTVKPRIGYGTNGNLQFFDIPSPNYYPTAQVYSNAGTYNGLGGVFSPSLVNTNLKWERTNSLNIGLDLGFLNNRITVISDYFIRNVFDKLESLPLSAQTGFTGITTNLSQLQNRGFELGINGKIIIPSTPGGLSLDAGLTYYTVRNFAKKLPFTGTPGNRLGGFEVWDPKNPGKTKFVAGLIEGQRIGYDEVWAPKWDGIYRTQAELDADANVVMDYLPYTNRKFKQLGDARWHQVYKNDTITQRQFVFVGRTTPKGSGSFFLNAGFKGFQLYSAFDYAYGFVILSNEKLRGLSQVQGSQNGTKDILNTWTPDNPTATLPRFYWANQGRNFATDASGNNPPANMWEKGDYIMLRELTLSYELSPKVMSTVFKDAVKGLNFSVTGSNLVYFTKYSGTFPEVGGIDNGRYPLPRRISLAARVTL